MFHTVLALGGAQALAATGPTIASRSFAAPARWHVAAELHLPDPVRFEDTDAEGRSETILLGNARLEAVLACGALDARRVDCEVHDLAILARPSDDDRALLAVLLAVLEPQLEDARIELRLDRRDGIRTVEVHGLRAADAATRHNVEVVETLLERALSLLDLPGPALAPGAASWTQRQPLLLDYPDVDWSLLNDVSPVTRGQLDHTPIATVDGWTLTSAGDGVVSGRVLHPLSGECTAWLDTDSRLLSRRCETVGGHASAAFAYVQELTVRRMDEGEAVEALASGAL